MGWNKLSINAPEPARLPLMLMWLAALVFAQVDTPRRLPFETASVKRAERCSLQNSVDPTMISLNGDPLKIILKEAFRVSADQIVGPPWLETECIQITATLPAGAGPRNIPEMLQNLLIERLKLTFHKENRTQSGYGLVADKSGLKVKESDPDSAYNIAHSGQVTFGAAAGTASIKGSMTISTLARLLSRRLKAPVEDLTGLKQKFYIDLSWAPGPEGAVIAPPGAPIATAPGDPGADLFTAIRNSLGLRLQPHKQQVEFIVIDHLERVPAAN